MDKKTLFKIGAVTLATGVGAYLIMRGSSGNCSICNSIGNLFSKVGINAPITNLPPTQNEPVVQPLNWGGCTSCTGGTTVAVSPSIQQITNWQPTNMTLNTAGL